MAMNREKSGRNSNSFFFLLLFLSLEGAVAANGGAAGGLGAFAEAVDRRVMHKVPDEETEAAFLALVDLGRLDDLLLDGAGPAPDDHVTGSLVVVGGDDEAGIIRAEGGGEHACTPGPPGLHNAAGSLGHEAEAASGVLEVLDGFDGMESLLLTRVGDLGEGVHEGHGEQVAITNSEDLAVTPDLLVTVDDLETEVDGDPATATRAAFGGALLRHEIIGGLDTDADVGLVGLATHADGFVEARLLGGVLDLIFDVDALGAHVIVTVVRGGRGERSKAVGQEIDDAQFQVGEVMLQLSDPFDTDETGTNHEDGGLLLVELIENIVFLEDMAAATLDESLINVGPGTSGTVVLVDGGEPERFTLGMEGTKIASRGDDAVIEGDLLDGVREHGLDHSIGLLELLALTPQELNTQLTLEHILEGEGEGVEMGRLHVGTEDTWCVLEVLLGIADGDVEALLQIAGTEEAGETTTDDEDIFLFFGHVGKK